MEALGIFAKTRCHITVRSYCGVGGWGGLGALGGVGGSGSGGIFWARNSEASDKESKSAIFSKTL